LHDAVVLATAALRPSSAASASVAVTAVNAKRLRWDRPAPRRDGREARGRVESVSRTSHE
jgi:hypothetical protein